MATSLSNSSLRSIQTRSGNLVGNPNYHVTIRRAAFKNQPEIIVMGNLPESFAFGVSASYDQRLPSDLTAVVPGLRNVQPFLNVNKILQELSLQVWDSSSPFEFSVPLLFDAVSDPETDVMTPIKSLMALTLPYRNCLLYTSPSPRDQRGSRMPSSA